LKGKILVTGLAICFISVLIIGNKSYNNKISTKAKASKIAYQKDLEKEKEMEKQNKIKSLTPDGKPLSVIDYLQYVYLKNGSVTISLLGSSATEGTGASKVENSWGGRLKSNLSKDLLQRNVQNLTINNDGFSAYSTEKLITDNKVDLLISQKPELVIFETALLSDYEQNVPVKKTLNNISNIVATIKKSLPNTRIIIQSPNPSTKTIGKNKTGITYDEYVKQSSALITSNNWEYIDIFNGYQSKLKEKNLELKDTLFDGLHPNDTGYEIWFGLLNDYLNQKQNLKF
jgi:lysophospholipase L1-like esterase